MLRRGLCPRLSFAPFPRRIPPHPARPTFTPRKRTDDARPQTPSARLPLSRQMQAMPASAACLPPASRRQIFCPPFPRAGCFLFVLPQMRRVSSVPRRMRGRKAGQMRRGTDVFSLFAPLSPDSKGLPAFFGRRNSILVHAPFFRCAQKTACAEQSPLSESAASKNTAAEPAAQTHIFRRTKAKRPAPHFRAAQGALKNSDEASADSCGRPRRKILRAPHAAAPASFFINT